jgi:hypothetical protein
VRSVREIQESRPQPNAMLNRGRKGREAMKEPAPRRHGFVEPAVTDLKRKSVVGAIAAVSAQRSDISPPGGNGTWCWRDCCHRRIRTARNGRCRDRFSGAFLKCRFKRPLDPTAGSVRDRAIAPSAATSSSPIANSIACRHAAMTSNQSRKLTSHVEKWESRSHDPFHGIDALQHAPVIVVHSLHR